MLNPVSTGQPWASAAINPPVEDASDISDAQLATMPAPSHVTPLLWQYASPQERRALLEQGDSPPTETSRGESETASLPPLSAPAWIAGSAISEHGKGILRGNPELAVRWISTKNLNREAGFTEGLENLLREKGIEVDDKVRNRPDSVVSNAHRHRTANGNAARDAIAAEFDRPGNRVRTEVGAQTPIITDKHPTGMRYVDVVVDTPGPTAETATRLDIESKLGKAGLDSTTRLQAEKDGWRLMENSRLRNWGERLNWAGRVMKPVGIIMDGTTIGQSWRAEGGFGPATQRTTAGVAGGATGGAAGAWAGAAAGAAIGSAVPVIGTAIGGIVGGLIGAFGGSWAGEAAAHAAYDAARSS